MAYHFDVRRTKRSTGLGKFYISLLLVTCCEFSLKAIAKQLKSTDKDSLNTTH